MFWMVFMRNTLYSVSPEGSIALLDSAAACMEKAAELDKKLIIAVGNAPTALVRLYELIGEGKIKPALIIGVPVGFVNVVQSKELIMQTNIPYIVIPYFYRKGYGRYE